MQSFSRNFSINTFMSMRLLVASCLLAGASAGTCAHHSRRRFGLTYATLVLRQDLGGCCCPAPAWLKFVPLRLLTDSPSPVLPEMVAHVSPFCSFRLSLPRRRRTSPASFQPCQCSSWSRPPTNARWRVTARSVCRTPLVGGAMAASATACRGQPLALPSGTRPRCRTRRTASAARGSTSSAIAVRPSAVQPQPRLPAARQLALDLVAASRTSSVLPTVPPPPAHRLCPFS